LNGLTPQGNKFHPSEDKEDKALMNPGDGLREDLIMAERSRKEQVLPLCITNESQYWKRNDLYSRIKAHYLRQVLTLKRKDEERETA
jgi:hypothetical protein